MSDAHMGAHAGTAGFRPSKARVAIGCALCSAPNSVSMRGHDHMNYVNTTHRTPVPAVALLNDAGD